MSTAPRVEAAKRDWGHDETGCTVLHIDMDAFYAYRMMSHRIFSEVFSQITDRIEQVSVDECYMDVSGALLRWGSPSAIGAWVRRQVAARYHVTCSVGIAANKLVAKMASTNAKPDGMLLIPKARHAEFVQIMAGHPRHRPLAGTSAERVGHRFGGRSGGHARGHARPGDRFGHGGARPDAGVPRHR